MTDLMHVTLDARKKALIALLWIGGGGLIGLSLLVSLDGWRVVWPLGRATTLGCLLGATAVTFGIVLATAKGRRAVGRHITHEPPIAAAKIAPMAAWFGLLAGLLEAAIFAILTFALGQLDPTYVFGPHILWMAPLVDILIFLMLGLGLTFINWLWPGLITLRIALLAYSGLASWILLLSIPGLHQYAVLLLAAGISVQFSSWAAAHPQQIGRAFRLATGAPARQDRAAPTAEAASGAGQSDFLPSRRQFLVGTGTVLAGAAVVTYGLTRMPGLRTPVKAASAAGQSPNILLLVLDTVRAQNVSLHGYARPTTPNLERLAQSGVRFEWAFSAAPWTLPSHASMFTGRWPHELSVDFLKPLDGTHPTLAETLRDAGYDTAGFVANLSFCCKPYGLARGFSHYEDFPVSTGQAVLSTELGRIVTNKGSVRRLAGYPDVLNRKNAGRISADFLKWQAYQGSRPFFAFVNYFDAHQPYLPPAPFDTTFGPGRTGQERFGYYTNDAALERMWEFSPEEVEREIAAYDGAIAYLDHEIGLLVDELSARGALDNTVVIITSDHGEQLGEHGLFNHANSVYTQTTHVPLVIFGADKVPAGAAVGSPISLRNLPATILELAGVNHDGLIPGDSLSSAWLSGSKPIPANAAPILSELKGGGFSMQDWYPNANGDVRAVVRDRYHYIRNGHGAEEVYDLLVDPFEQHNLVATIEGPLLAQLRQDLDGFYPW